MIVVLWPHDFCRFQNRRMKLKKVQRTNKASTKSVRNLQDFNQHQTNNASASIDRPESEVHRIFEDHFPKYFESFTSDFGSSPWVPSGYHHIQPPGYQQTSFIDGQWHATTVPPTTSSSTVGVYSTTNNNYGQFAYAFDSSNPVSN